MKLSRLRQFKPVVAVLIAFFCQGALAQIKWETLLEGDFSITIDQQFVLNSDTGGRQKNQTTIQPRFDFALSDSIELTAIGRARFDTETKLGFDGSNEHVDLELRELYLDAEWGGAYWRLGKQQIVWGQADGLRVLDVINPLELREFVLPEFEDRRIPLWTANVEVPLGEVWTAQFLLIPDQTYDELAEFGGSFEIRSPLLVPTPSADVPVSVLQLDKPKRLIKDADTGARFSAFIGGWDVSLNYLYHYQDQPVLYQFLDDSAAVIAPTYERTHLFGGSVSNVFGDITFRAELGYSTDRYFLSNDPADVGGIERSGEYSYVVGFDYQGWRDWFVSTQLFQSVVSRDSPGMIREEIETSATFLLRRNFLNDSLLAEALLIQSMDRDDGVLQLSLEYEWSTNIQITFASDSFFGSSAGLFGQFDDKDRVSVGIEFSY